MSDYFYIKQWYAVTYQFSNRKGGLAKVIFFRIKHVMWLYIHMLISIDLCQRKGTWAKIIGANGIAVKGYW